MQMARHGFSGAFFALCLGISLPLAAATEETLTTVNGGTLEIRGEGTLKGDLDVFGGGSVAIGGKFTSPGDDVRLGCSKGTLTIEEGADISVTSICLVNSNDRSNDADFNINGKLTVTSSCGATVYGQHTQHRGILFGHYYGRSDVVVGPRGELVATNTWIQMCFSSPSSLTVDGGAVRTIGLNMQHKSDIPVTVRNGGVLELRQGLVSQNNGVWTFDGGTLRAGDSFDWTPSTTQIGSGGLTLDANGHALTLQGTYAGEGAIRCTNTSETAGVINLGTSRPEGPISIGPRVTLGVTLASETERIVLKMASRPAEGALVVRDASGNVVENLASNYDEGTGTLTLEAAYPTWREGETASFEDSSNWTPSLASDGSVFVEVEGETRIAVGEAHAFDKMIFRGSGRVTFEGPGSLESAATRVAGGVEVVFPAGYAFGALAVEDGGVAVSEGGATIASTSGGGTFSVTNGTVTLGEGGNQALNMGVRHTRIERGGVLSFNGRDTFTNGSDGEATLTVEAGGKFTTSSFNELPKVRLNGGTVESTGAWNAWWSTVCYGKGVTVGGATVSYLTTTVPQNAAAGHQLATGLFEIGEGATLQVDVSLRDGPGDRGTLRNQIRKTGPGRMVVNVAPAYSGRTEIAAGEYELNALHATTRGEQEYTVAANAVLGGAGGVTGSARVSLAGESKGTWGVLAGELKVDNLAFASGAYIGSSSAPADVAVANVLTNSNLNGSQQAWLNVRNGSLTLSSGIDVTPAFRIHVTKSGALVAGAGSERVALPHAPQAEKGALLASEVRRGGTAATGGTMHETGRFDLTEDFDLANWTVGLKVLAGVSVPRRVAVVLLGEGCSYSNFQRKAVPENVRNANLYKEGRKLFYEEASPLLLLLK